MILQMLCALGATGPVAAAAASSNAAKALAEGIDPEMIHGLAKQFRAADSAVVAMRTVQGLLADLASEPDRLLRRLRASMHADYREARTVQLSGWFVSRTEGALIAALSDSLRS